MRENAQKVASLKETDKFPNMFNFGFISKLENERALAFEAILKRWTTCLFLFLIRKRNLTSSYVSLKTIFLNKIFFIVNLKGI